MPTVRPRTTIYLWEFLLQLLDGDEKCSAITWVNRERGEFVLKDQSEIAKLWGRVKGRPRMDKIKLGRAMRYYYKKKLLAKVPRCKAVYRFVKFDYIKDKQSDTCRELPEIDYNSIFGISDDKSEGGSSLPGEVEQDVDDTPLECMLAGGKENLILKEEGSRRVDITQNTFGSIENITEDLTTGCSFYDYHCESDLNMVIPTSDHYVPCTDIPRSESNQNYSGYLQNGPVTSYSMAPTYSPHVDCNGNFNPHHTDSGHLASLLMSSILLSDHQITGNPTDCQAVPSYVPPAVNSTPIISTTSTQLKHYPLLHPNFTSEQLPDETQITWSSLKEFERLTNRNF